MRARSHPRHGDLQARIAERSREHRQIASGRKIDGARALRFEERRGAYVLAEADARPRAVTLLASGSEVTLALQARRQLQDEGIATAVVSMPCWEIFDAQDAPYRSGVLGPGTVRVGVEAALRFGWDRYPGERSGFVGMMGFGASAAAETLYEHFGITAQHIVAEAKRHL